MKLKIQDIVNTKDQDTASFLNLFPSSMKFQIVEAIYLQVFIDTKFLQCKPLYFIAWIIENIKNLIYKQDEIIYEQNNEV